MFTKKAWEEWKINIDWYKKYNKSQYTACTPKGFLYILLLVLIIMTPILVLVDISLLPLEIVYYFFCKWLERENK